MVPSSYGNAWAGGDEIGHQYLTFDGFECAWQAMGGTPLQREKRQAPAQTGPDSESDDDVDELRQHLEDSDDDRTTPSQKTKNVKNSGSLRTSWLTAARSHISPLQGPGSIWGLRRGCGQ